jgi:uncharacterized membrane protein (DUF4010 family)
MNEIDLFHRFALAAAIGALVGVERHWRERDEPAGQRTAGLRTFTLVGMLGGGAGLLEKALGGGASLAGLVTVGLAIGLAATLTLFKLREASADNDFSATTVVAALLAYVLGVLSVVGDMRIAAAGGVIMTAVLASREALHGFMRKVTWGELRSAIVLLAMTLVVLPLVPDRPFGPFGGVSPARIWILAILVAGLSYLGYVAARLLGTTRGEIVAGAVAGLVSSTAATVSSARRSVREGALADLLAASTLAANAVANVRTAVLAVALAPALAPIVVVPLAAIALVMASGALLLGRSDSVDGDPDPGRNPFEILPVLQMAALIGAFGFAARASAQWFGESGLYVVSGLTALADVDATTLTAAGMVASGLSAETAGWAILIGAAANTLAKMAYAAALGTGRFTLLVGSTSLAALAAGFAATWLRPWVQALTEG